MNEAFLDVILYVLGWYVVPTLVLVHLVFWIVNRVGR